MDTNKPTRSMPTVALLVVVIIALATSTVYFAYLPRSSTSTSSTSSPDTYSAYSIPYVGNVVAAASGSTDPTSGTSSTANTITVGGSGGVSYTPNEALVSVSIVANNDTAEQATSWDAARTLSVIKALNGIDISNSSIETQGYSLSANYANCNYSCTPQITGYTVTNSLQVNITSATPSQLGSEAGRAIDTAVKAGANQINLAFSETSSFLDTLTNGALQQAITSASNQAHVIASSLGVTITGVVSASEGSSNTPQYYVPRGVADLYTVATPIIPGTQSFTVSVQVVYAIS